MAAFSSNNITGLEANIYALYRRMWRAVVKNLTVDDFLNLFVAPEHHAAFKALGPLINRSPFEQQIKFMWGDTQLVYAVPVDTPIPTPRCAMLQPTAPPELIASTDNWLMQGGNVGRDLGRVRAVLWYLNEKCSRQELRYFWPSILPLLVVDEHKKDLCEIAKQLADVKVPKSPPALPPQMRVHLRKATETVAMASLLPPDIVDQPILAKVYCYAQGAGGYDEPGLSYTGLS